MTTRQDSMTPQTWRIALAVLLAALTLGACSTGPEVQRETFEAPRYDALLSEARARFDDHLPRVLTPPGLAPAVEQAFAAQADTAPETRRIHDLYRDRDHTPLFLAGGQWSENNDQLVEAFEASEHHALYRDYRGWDHYASRKAELVPLATAVQELQRFQVTELDWREVERRLRDEGFDASTSHAIDQLMDRLASPGHDNPMPRLAGRIRNMQWTSRDWVHLVARLEVDLALDFGHYAQEMRVGHLENTTRTRLWEGVFEDNTAIRARLGAVFAFYEKHGAADALASLVPEHPQYTKLVNARKRYAEIVAQGGWPSVSKLSRGKLKRMRRGVRMDILKDIKERLVIEGYEVGEINDRYDDALGDAVELYRLVHQLSRKGSLDNDFIHNLNIKASDRLAKIDVTLRRHRKSLVGNYNDYIVVNLPDFAIEVYRDQEVAMRFRTVIGNNAIQKDLVTGKPVLNEDGQIFHPNRTIIQDSFIKTVIYNPYWNVPPRIRQEELEVELAKNPFYYMENNFEVVHPDKPDWMYVRQLPGPWNTLGQVKFLFPNPDAVFLHDTQHHSLFKNAIRSYSHGCIRLQKPYKFAQHLLEVDGQWDPESVKLLLGTEPYVQTYKPLRDPIPFHIAYFNTRVDDAGVVAFLSDIYEYDEDAIEARIAEVEKRYSPEKQARN